MWVRSVQGQELSFSEGRTTSKRSRICTGVKREVARQNGQLLPSAVVQ